MIRSLRSSTLIAVASAALAACAPAGPTELDELDEAAESESEALTRSVFAVDISLWSGEITDAEVRCWYEQGVRHVIVGTQNPRISRQQLDMAIAGGMTVDLYEYLYWNVSMTKQVEEALVLADEYPEVGRLWLDAEENPGSFGRVALTQKLEEALTACGEVECGIYTAKWWWQPAMQNSTAFNHVPLWYALYDLNPSMDTWSTQKFGGWATPTAKQWQETYFCGIDVDKNTMLVSVEQPEAPAPLGADQPGAPAAPTGHYPSGGIKIEIPNIRLLVDTIPGATDYAFEIETWNGSKFAPYITYGSKTNARKFSANYKNRVYRWRARAKDGEGWGSWSDWAMFDQGKPTSRPPSAEPTPEPEPAPEPDPTPEPEPEPAVPGAPAILAPTEGATIKSGQVNLSCESVQGASSYAFEIQIQNPTTQAWGTYFTYTGTTASRSFYPQTLNRNYRVRARAKTGTTWTPDSAWRGFRYGN